VSKLIAKYGQQEIKNHVCVKRGFLLHTRIFLILFTIACFVMSSFAQEDKPVIGVLGLDNRGGLTDLTIDTICNKISDLMEQFQNFYVLKREFIPPVLEEQGFTISKGACSQKEILVAAGILLSADQMIGGTIQQDGDKLNIEFQRVKVQNRKVLGTQQISSSSSRKELMEFELPVIIEALLYDMEESPSPVPTAAVDKTKTVAEDTKRSDAPVIRERRRKFPLLITMLGIGLAGAAGAYIYHEKHNPDNDVINGVPLSGHPQHD